MLAWICVPGWTDFFVTVFPIVTAFTFAIRDRRTGPAQRMLKSLFHAKSDGTHVVVASAPLHAVAVLAWIRLAKVLTATSPALAVNLAQIQQSHRYY